MKSAPRKRMSTVTLRISTAFISIRLLSCAECTVEKWKYVSGATPPQHPVTMLAPSLPKKTWLVLAEEMEVLVDHYSCLVESGLCDWVYLFIKDHATYWHASLWKNCTNKDSMSLFFPTMSQLLCTCTTAYKNTQSSSTNTPWSSRLTQVQGCAAMGKTKKL